MIEARKLRVLVTTDAVGGVWVYSVDLARALQHLGVEVLLAVMGPSPDDEQRSGARGIRLIETGLPLDWTDVDSAQLARAGRQIADIAAAEGAEIVQTCSAAILAEARFAQPTVAVQHSCVASWWAAVRGTPLPTDFQWRRELVAAGLRRADAVVTPTAAFAAETARIYGLGDRVLPVHNGRRSAGSDPTERRDFVLTASRLWDDGKDVPTLDAAAAQLDAPFLAAGAAQGPNGASVRLDHLDLVGQLPAARLADLLATRPVFASAAVYEPFGLSVLEAAQAGCALVLSNIATHRELWGDAALYVTARDPDAFAAAIRRLLDDRSLRMEMGDAARRQAARYTPGRMAGAMALVYANVLADAAECAPSRELAGAA